MEAHPAAQASSASSEVKIPDGKDPEETWIFIRDRLYQPFSSPKIRPQKEYMDCYSAVFNFMNFAHQQPLQGGPVCRKLYRNIETFLRSGLQSLSQSLSESLSQSPSNILQKYLSQWESFVTGTKYNGNVLRYMSRHYVKRARDEGNLEVWPFEKMSFLLWKREVFDAVKGDLLNQYRKEMDEEDDKDGEVGEDWVKVSEVSNDGEEGGEGEGEGEDGETERVARRFRESYELLRREVEVMGERIGTFEESIRI